MRCYSSAEGMLTQGSVHLMRSIITCCKRILQPIHECVRICKVCGAYVALLAVQSWLFGMHGLA